MKANTHLRILGWVFCLGMAVTVAHAESSPSADATTAESSPDSLAPVAPAVTEPVATETSADLPEAEKPQTGKVTLVSSGNTYLLVRQEKDTKILFKGRVHAGQTIELERTGVVRVVSPEIECIAVKIGDKTYKSNDIGLRQTWYGLDGPIPPPQGQ